MSKVNLVGEFDASKWAKEFVRTVKENPAIATDESTMIGWFANAIMAGYDKDKQERESAAREAVVEYDKEIGAKQMAHTMTSYRRKEGIGSDWIEIRKQALTKRGIV
jgi:hypothetical protein